MKSLQSIIAKYSQLTYNTENYEIGGGLSDEKYVSNRHEDASNDEGKLTKGQTVQIFKKATKCTTEEANEIIDFCFPRLEWHHSGCFKGKMSKTYFVNCEQIVFLAENWNDLLAKKQAKEAKELAAEQAREAKKIKQVEFLNQNAKFVERCSNTKFDIVTNEEMLGKRGYFPASWKYKTEIYKSGWVFNTQEAKDFYFANLA